MDLVAIEVVVIMTTPSHLTKVVEAPTTNPHQEEAL
jgi:hypothetical protein